MTKEGNPSNGFERTRELVRTVYEESYDREHKVKEEDLDKSLPYSASNGKFFQAQFNQTEIRPGETIPLTMMSLDKEERPQAGVKAIKRRSNATLLYIFASEKDPNEGYQTLNDIGNLYGVTQEMIRQDNKRNLSDLHSVATAKTRKEFPLIELATKRPRTLASRMRGSRGRDGHMSEIFENTKRGMSTRDLIDEYGYQAVNKAGRIFKDLDLPAPERINRDFRPAIEEINNPDTSMERLRELILEFDHHGLSGFYSKGDNPVLIFISKLQEEAWGNSNNRLTEDAYEMLRKAGLPINSVPLLVSKDGKAELVGTYFFTFSRTRQEALDVLDKADSSYKYRPVNQIAGPKIESIPNTTELHTAQKGEWVRVNKPGWRWSNERVKCFFQDCPVSVVLHRTQKGIVEGYYVRKGDIDTFKTFVSSRTAEFDSK